MLVAEPTAAPRRRRAVALPVVLLLAALGVGFVALWPRAEAGPPRLTVVASGATPAGIGDEASVYVLIDDAGGADRLVSATSPVSATVTLHQTESTTDRGDLMTDLGTMVVPAKGRLAMVPGGNHLMLHHVFEPLDPGDVVTLTITFERSGDLVVDVPVRPLAELADLGRLS